MKPQAILKRVLAILAEVIIAVALVVGILFVLGIRPFVVVSGSMVPTLPINSVCFVNTNTDYEDIEVGDIIIYRRFSDDLRVIHRVIAITDEGLETKGDANAVSDGISTTADNLVGKMLICIPALGAFITWARTPAGIAVLAVVILLLLFGDDLGKWINTRGWKIHGLGEDEDEDQDDGDTEHMRKEH